MNVLRAIAQQKTLNNFVVYGHVENGHPELNGLPNIVSDKERAVKLALYRELKAYPKATYYAAWVVIDEGGVVVMQLEVDCD